MPPAASYRDWTFGVASQSQPLARDPLAFLEGAFGPLAPIVPAPIDIPADGLERAEPRRFEYPVAWNKPTGRPGTEGLKLAAFVQLRAFADMYSLVRAAIEVRKQEIAGIEWELVPTKEAQARMKADDSATSEWTARARMVEAFWKRPDPEYQNFKSWLGALLEDLFVVDAPALYLHPSRLPGKGAMASDIAALELVDGTTIRPLLDMRGSRPKPPNPAYQQYLWGVPRADLMQVILGQDLEELRGLQAVEQYRGDQLMYLPYLRRSWTPYGFPGIERALLPVVTGLKKQQFALEFFTEGTIPGMFVIPGPGIDTPEQIRKLQDTLNFLAGDQAWKHKIIVLPHGSETDKHKAPEIASQYDDVIAAEVCMAYEVHPDEIGLQMGSKSKGIQFGGSATASDNQDEQRKRKATKPLLGWLKDSIFDYVTQQVLRQTDIEWSWIGWQDEDDQAAVAVRLLADVKSGVLTIDEYRKEFGREPYGFPATSEPLIISERGIVVPLQHLDTAAIADAINDPVGLDAEKGLEQPPADAKRSGGSENTDAGKAARADVLTAQLAELDQLRRAIKKGRTSWESKLLGPALVKRVLERRLTFAEARNALRKSAEALVAAGYAPAESMAESCGSCFFFANGFCRMFEQPVVATATCQEWVPASGEPS